VLNFSSINKAIKRIIRDCNDEILLKEELTEDTVLLPMFSCHSLRHSFATNMVESGVDIKTCQSILGHCDISTTYNIYVDVTKAMLDKSVQEYNAMRERRN
jgi:site-specific recombinase XerD